MATRTTSSSDASTILTVGELSHEDATSSSASFIDSSPVSSATKATEQSRNRYDSNSWVTATDTPRRRSEKSSPEGTETNGSSESISEDDGDDTGRRGGARRKDVGGNSSDSGESSYYSADWESNQDFNSYSDWDASATSQVYSTRHRFIQAKLKLLEQPRHKPETKTTQETATPHLESKERNTFCQNAIGVIEKKTTLKHDVASTKPRLKGRSQSSRNSSIADTNVLINREIINRLKIENLLTTMKKVASTDVGEQPDSFKHCREMQEASLRRGFIRQRTSRLENELTERRVDWLLNTRDPLTAIGDLAQSLPMPSDDPTEIWDRLMNQGLT